MRFSNRDVWASRSTGSVRNETRQPAGQQQDEENEADDEDFVKLVQAPGKALLNLLPTVSHPQRLWLLLEVSGLN